jgi:hypothetical protein
LCRSLYIKRFFECPMNSPKATGADLGLLEAALPWVKPGDRQAGFCSLEQLSLDRTLGRRKWHYSGRANSNNTSPNHSNN